MYKYIYITLGIGTTGTTLNLYVFLHGFSVGACGTTRNHIYHHMFKQAGPGNLDSDRPLGLSCLDSCSKLDFASQNFCLRFLITFLFKRCSWERFEGHRPWGRYILEIKSVMWQSLRLRSHVYLYIYIYIYYFKYRNHRNHIKFICVFTWFQRWGLRNHAEPHLLLVARRAAGLLESTQKYFFSRSTAWTPASSFCLTGKLDYGCHFWEGRPRLVINGVSPECFFKTSFMGLVRLLGIFRDGSKLDYSCHFLEGAHVL